jgi:hypothetical protein
VTLIHEGPARATRLRDPVPGTLRRAGRPAAFFVRSHGFGAGQADRAAVPRTRVRGSSPTDQRAQPYRTWPGHISISVRTPISACHARDHVGLGTAGAGAVPPPSRKRPGDPVQIALESAPGRTRRLLRATRGQAVRRYPAIAGKAPHAAIPTDTAVISRMLQASIVRADFGGTLRSMGQLAGTPS